MKKKSSPAAQQRSIVDDYTDLKKAQIAIANGLVLIDKNIHFFNRMLPPDKRAIIVQQLKNTEHQLTQGTATLREVLALIQPYILSDTELQEQQAQYNAECTAARKEKEAKMTPEERQAKKERKRAYRKRNR